MIRFTTYPDMTSATVGERMKWFRKIAELTAAELGEIFGLTNKGIYDMEGGISHPQLKYLIKLHEEYGLDLNWLATGKARDIVTPPAPVASEPVTITLTIRGGAVQMSNETSEQP